MARLFSAHERKVQRMTKQKILAIGVALLASWVTLPSLAQAADPECANVWDGVGEYDTKDGIKICTPEVDVDGDPLPPGS